VDPGSYTVIVTCGGETTISTVTTVMATVGIVAPSPSPT
jgi:hypothetical protein